MREFLSRILTLGDLEVVESPEVLEGLGASPLEAEVGPAPLDVVGSVPLDGLGAEGGADPSAVVGAAVDAAQGAVEAGIQPPVAIEGVSDAITEAASSVADSASDLAGAAASASAAVADAPMRYDGFLSPLSNALEQVLGVLQHGLEFLHVPYSYGFSIILLTVFVRASTYPLTKKQAEVSMAAMELKPTIDRIKRRFGDDKDRINMETARLYEMTKINPLAGCLPTFASIPIFLGLYYSLGNVANEGLLENEGFFWIPSLAGPTSLALRKSGAGTSWLFPFVDGHPPIGWEAAQAYVILPALLVVIQYTLSALISPPKDPEAEENKTLQVVTKLLPLTLGWFSLNVPAGLTLYYFSNVSLLAAQQIYLRKLGGAKVDLGIELPEEKYGVGRRRADKQEPLIEGAASVASEVILVEEEDSEDEALPAQADQLALAAVGETEGIAEEEQEAAIDRRCKRKRIVPAPGSAMALMQKGMIPLQESSSSST
ncbi:membrane protein insertase [Chloropicon primus]|uniref:Membrane protein insertase n=2 Tax=Chloropicon primus TaxID=1764295 RepID=A0A5B8MRA9_9CHLO|nr:membrane protein insertase [Chloropicon primus]UPR02190.1 membrane protein insertase [Chloropicon primus]|eukprot:QDZ22973.1 membrane protein insertase [Chloropicon primus]